MRDTTYIKESASLQRSFILVSEVEGAMRGTYESLIPTLASQYLVQRLVFLFERRDLPSLCTKVPKAYSLLRRQVTDYESIDAHILTIFKQSLLSIAEHRVVISHK